MLTDREVASLVDLMKRTLERVRGRGMPELDAEVAWWIQRGQVELDARIAHPSQLALEEIQGLSVPREKHEVRRVIHE